MPSAGRLALGSTMLAVNNRSNSLVTAAQMACWLCARNGMCCWVSASGQKGPARIAELCRHTTELTLSAPPSSGVVQTSQWLPAMRGDTLGRPVRTPCQPACRRLSIECRIGRLASRASVAGLGGAPNSCLLFRAGSANSRTNSPSLGRTLILPCRRTCPFTCPWGSCQRARNLSPTAAPYLQMTISKNKGPGSELRRALREAWSLTAVLQCSSAPAQRQQARPCPPCPITGPRKAWATGGDVTGCCWRQGCARGLRCACLPPPHF